MKNQFVINFIVNEVAKNGTISIYDDELLLFVDGKKMDILYSNVKGGYVDNSGLIQIVLNNDVKLTINGFDNTEEIFKTFEENKNNYHEVVFFEGDSKTHINIIPIIFKSLIYGGLAGAAVYFIPMILEEYKDVYNFDFPFKMELWYVIVGGLIIALLNTISEINKKKITTKVNVNADDLINAVTKSMQSCEKILDENSVGIVVDTQSNDFCIIKPPFTNYKMCNLVNVLSSDIVVDNSINPSYCTKLYIKIRINDNGIIVNDYIPFITSRIIMNSSEYQTRYAACEKLDAYLEGMIRRFHGDPATKKSSSEIRTQNVNANKGIEMDEWEI